MLNKRKENRINRSLHTRFIKLIGEITGFFLAIVLCMAIEYYRNEYLNQQTQFLNQQGIRMIKLFKSELLPVWKLWSFILVCVMYMFYKRVHIKLFVVFGLVLNFLAMYWFSPYTNLFDIEFIVMTLIYDFIEIVVIYYIFQLFIDSEKKNEF